MSQEIPSNSEQGLVQYRQAVNLIKGAILRSQARAAQGVNQEQLALYYGIGRYVSENSRKGFWGKGAIDNISRMLKEELPGLKGFSARNIRNMRQFYEQWSLLDSNLADASAKLQQTSQESNLADASAKLQVAIYQDNTIIPLQLTGYSDFPITAFLNIPFSHHIIILANTNSAEERKYYIQLAYEQRLSVDDLEKVLKAHVYEHRDNLPNNFFKTIPDKRLAMRTLKMLKDEYLLDFINVEQIDECDPEDIDESVIEKQIVMNIKNFIMTFGKSFTYRGHQVHYEKIGQDHWIDLLFYNRILRCMVVIELKKGKFKPAYLGQLAAYLRVLDDEEKLPDENPSIGLILCKKANKTYVEYVLQDYLKPMGVATYQTSLEQLKALLPPEEELKKLLPEEGE